MASSNNPGSHQTTSITPTPPSGAGAGAAAGAAQRPSSTSHTLTRKPSQQSLVEQVPPTSYNGQGSIQTMNELYEVGDVIGTGTFGIIRKVIRKSDGLVLARKELDYGRMDERDLKQLSEEVNILQNLDPNENIVRYYERYVDRQKFRLHIIMEYCHNGDLASQIQRCRRKNTLLREDVIWSYLTQIALALSDCHAELDAKGRPKQVILHRDIKPENVFLDKDNNIKLGDFGLSKAMASAAFTNTYVGTPYYMSPELINSQAYDQKSDIWALGCLIYELCAWHPPFHEARTQAELTKLIRDGRIPNLPSVYSKNLQEVVKSMLRQDPKHRPTIEQIKSLDEVKMQLRIAELRRMHEDLIHTRKELETREAAVLERERLVTIRERDLELERTDLQNERVRLATAFSTMSLYNNQSNSSTSGSSMTSTALSSRDNSPLMDQKENVNTYGVVGIGMPAPTGGNIGIQFPPEVQSMNQSPSVAPSSSEKTLARVASRPSLVPRRPLEERRSMVGLNTLSKRMSCQSLMAMAVDGETPVKPAGLSTPTAEARRRIATSKSMHNLKSSGGSRMEGSPTGRAFPASLVNSKQHQSFSQQYQQVQQQAQGYIHPQSASAAQTSYTQAPATLIARPASSSAVESTFPKRSDSSASLLNPSPSKRPGIVTRTATAPPTLPSAGSMTSISSFNGATVPSITTSAAPNTAHSNTHHQASHTGHLGGPGPKWNLDDEENLPSPFIKKKISAGPLRALVAQHSSTVSGGTGMSRGMSHGSLSSIASGNGTVNGPPGVPSRAGRPSTTRQSLAGRLALHRQAKVDEQGRKMATT